MKPIEFVVEGYTLKAVKREKFHEPGNPDEYVQDIDGETTDYEIRNNKTGKVVGTASMTRDNFLGGGKMFINMFNGAQRELRVRDDPQAAFNWFVKQERTSKKYKESVSETASVGGTSSGAVATVTASQGAVQKRRKKDETDLMLGETHKPGDWVVVTRGPRKGVVGTIGEIYHGSYKGAPKSYVIDIDGDYQKGSIRLLGSMFKAKKKVAEAKEDYYLDPDEYNEIRFNNEAAYEAAYARFGRYWEEPNPEQIYIGNYYLESLEDYMMSMGFDVSETDPEADVFLASEFGYQDELNNRQFEAWVAHEKKGLVEGKTLAEALKAAKKEYGAKANVLPRQPKVNEGMADGYAFEVWLNKKKVGIVYAINRSEAEQEAVKKYGPAAEAWPYQG